MDAAQDVKARLDIVDIIGEYLPLKPAGSGSFKANCPFHNEKSPSFMVNRPRQSWHCFGCNIGGDVFEFVEKIEGMEFREALELLAQKAGVTLPKFDQKAATAKKKLQDVNDYAAKLFRHLLLTDPAASVARSYVEKRGIDDLTADLWRIGYAPLDWTQAEKKLYEQGFTTSELVQAGLAANKESGQGIYFRFRGRLMFPICDAHGHVVGFTGRILGTENVAKYINTPETYLYRKSAVLYGLDKAKTNIKREDLAIIVEGNMDALTSHQFNVQNVVASSGTALTFEQLTLLKRYTNHVAMAFDADNAGINATLRGLDLARQMDLNIRIISFDSKAAKDPDELIRKDVELWKKAVSDATPIMEWIYRRAFTNFSPSTPDGKRNIAQFVLNECRYVAHPVERDAWITRLAKDLDVSTDSLRSALNKTQSSKLQAPSYKAETNRTRSSAISHQPTDDPSTPFGTGRRLTTDNDSQMTPERELEERWLSIMVIKPELLHNLEINWSYGPHASLYNLLAGGYNPSIPSSLAEADSETAKLTGYLTMLADREFPDQDVAILKRDAENVEFRLREHDMTRRRTDLEQAMREAERLGDTARINQLLSQFNSLT